MEESNNLVIMTFEGAATAATVYAEAEKLEKEKLITIKDAIILERSGTAQLGAVATPSSAGQGGAVSADARIDGDVRITQTHGKKGAYAAKGGGIGLLAGWILGGPVGGLVVGATIGAVTAAMKDLGISDANIDAVKARLQPNSSALLVLGHAADRDALIDRLRPYDPQIISTTLPPEVEKQVRDRLAG